MTYCDRPKEFTWNLKCMSCRLSLCNLVEHKIAETRNVSKIFWMPSSESKCFNGTQIWTFPIKSSSYINWMLKPNWWSQTTKIAGGTTRKIHKVSNSISLTTKRPQSLKQNWKLVHKMRRVINFSSFHITALHHKIIECLVTHGIIGSVDYQWVHPLKIFVI